MSISKLIKQANFLKRSKKLEEAITLYFQIISINPNFTWGYYNLGASLANQGRLDEAYFYYLQGLKSNPNSAFLQYQLSEFLAKQGNLNLASVYFQRFINSRIDLHDSLTKKIQKTENNFIKVNSFNIFQGEIYGCLTSQTLWFDLPTNEKCFYCIEGNIASANVPLLKKALIQFEFFDENKQYIPASCENLDNSNHLGYHRYIDIFSQNFTKFCVVFKTPPNTFYTKVGFRYWHNKRTHKPTIFLESQIKIYSSQFNKIEELSSWNYYKLGLLFARQDKFCEALFLCQKALTQNASFSKCEEKIRELIFKIEYNSSVEYWESRYEYGGNSGIGTYNNRLAEFKADVLNNLVEKENLKSVIEFGCGDGHQLKFAKYPEYIGLDVSKTAINMCKEKFKHDSTKSFFLYTPLCFIDKKQVFSADLSVSIDVLFHLIEDDIYYAYLDHLFMAAKKMVVIYSWNFENIDRFKFHIRPRKFTQDIEQIIQEWKLDEVVENIYPAEHLGEQEGSFSNFYIYRKF